MLFVVCDRECYFVLDVVYMRRVIVWREGGREGGNEGERKKGGKGGEREFEWKFNLVNIRIWFFFFGTEWF